MQVQPKEFNELIHEKFKALSVNQPYADFIKTGEKPLELRNQNVSYRGDVVICSTVKPILPGHECGVTIALVELYGTKLVKDLTPEEIESTKADKETLGRYKTGYAWQFRNPRPLIEFPVKGQLGLFTLVYTKDCIMPYPQIVKLPEETPRKKKTKLRRFWLKLIHHA